jgi:hypothetical protein
MWLSLGVEVCEFYFEGCSLEVSSDDGWLWILCLQCLFLLRCPS